jgi:hypothetical protein
VHRRGVRRDILERAGERPWIEPTDLGDLGLVPRHFTARDVAEKYVREEMGRTEREVELVDADETGA